MGAPDLKIDIDELHNQLREEENRKLVFGQLTKEPLTEIQLRTCVYYNQLRFRSFRECRRLVLNNLLRYRSRELPQTRH